MNKQPSSIHPSTFILDPLYVEPWCDHHVLDAKDLPDEQFHRQADEYRYRKHLKDQVLQERRALEDFLLELAPRDDQMNDQPGNDVKRRDDDQPEYAFPGLARDAENVGQVAVDFVKLNVMVPRLAGPEPHPSRPAYERADEDQRYPGVEAHDERDDG